MKMLLAIKLIKYDLCDKPSNHEETDFNFIRTSISSLIVDLNGLKL